MLKTCTRAKHVFCCDMKMLHNMKIVKGFKGQLNYLNTILVNFQRHKQWNCKKEIFIFCCIFFVIVCILAIEINFDNNTKLPNDYVTKSPNNSTTVSKSNLKWSNKMNIENIVDFPKNNNTSDIESFDETRLLDEDIIFQPVIERNFQAFYKWLTAQKFINEDFDDNKLMDFIELFNLATGVSKIASIEKVSGKTRDGGLPECVATLNYNVTVNLNKSANQYPDNIYPMVLLGGYYKPMNCRPQHKIAILVPIRDREENLRIFIYNIHPFLMVQNIEYKIFVFEQVDDKIPFNKGRVFNAGFREIEKAGGWDCIIFHDVDLLPTDYRIRYICPILPTHMCPTVIEMLKYKFYSTVFGGVTAMSLWQYKVVNGYSNMYWAWGAEDNDMFKRLSASGFSIARYNKNIARYTTLHHPKSQRNHGRLKLLYNAAKRISWDGLSNNVYKKIKTTLHPLYTRIQVCINPNHDAVPSLTTPRNKHFLTTKPTQPPGLFTSWLSKLKRVVANYYPGKYSSLDKAIKEYEDRKYKNSLKKHRIKKA